MTSNVVQIENLSRKYVINSCVPAREDTLRDVVLSKVANRKLGHRQKIEKQDFWALKNINLNIEKGERVGILGKNGAGKSTLLKVLSRITEPTSGRVKIKGKVASLLEVGTGFHPELSGRENIFLNGAILGMHKFEIVRKFDEIVDFSGVEQFLDTPVKRYSSGMYVRLAFAVAAHLEPDILIVDEVLAVGDAEFQKKCLGKMSSSSRDGRTIIFVSHNLGAIKALCSRAFLMEQGSASEIMDVNDCISLYQKSISEKSNTSLKVIGKNDGIFFENFVINNSQAKSEVELFSGEPLVIKFDYFSKYIGQDLCISIGLKNITDNSIVAFTHNHLESVKHKTGECGKIVVTLDLPKLSSMSYALIFQTWTDGNIVIDEVELLNLIISPVPTFKSQGIFSKFPSVLMIDSDWQFLEK